MLDVDNGTLGQPRRDYVGHVSNSLRVLCIPGITDRVPYNQRQKFQWKQY